MLRSPTLTRTPSPVEGLVRRGHREDSVVKRAIDEETKKADEKDQNIQRLKKKLESSGTSDLRAGQLRAKMLRDASEVFGAAIERYKSDLRSRVEATPRSYFCSMTTEKEDFAGLTINESYGLDNPAS